MPDWHERQDIEQTLRIELIKSYKNHRKYDNWNRIVWSIISRRIQDYKKKLRKVQHFGDIFGCTDIHDHDLKLEFLINLHNDKGGEFTFDSVEYLQHIWDFIVDNYEMFDQWELDYVTMLYDSYESGNYVNMDNEYKRSSQMGYKRTRIGEFRIRVAGFVSKIKTLMSNKVNGE